MIDDSGYYCIKKRTWQNLGLTYTLDTVYPKSNQNSQWMSVVLWSESVPGRNMSTRSYHIMPGLIVLIKKWPYIFDSGISCRSLLGAESKRFYTSQGIKWKAPNSVLSSTIQKSHNFNFQIHFTIQIQGGHFLFESNSLSLLVCLDPFQKALFV